MRIKVFGLTAAGLAFCLDSANGVKLNEETSFQEELAEIDADIPTEVDADGDAPVAAPVAAPI